MGIKIHMYFTERALVCAEQMTNGKLDARFVVISYYIYISLSHCPPLQVVRKSNELLASHYPEWLDKFFFVDARFIFNVFGNSSDVFISGEVCYNV